jgi:O-antigen ligase
MIGLVVLAAILLLVYGDSPFFQRLLAIDDDPSTTERIGLIQDSLQQIAASPWLGSASVELKSGAYPHNIFLEGALSFGLPLTAVLAILLSHGLFKSLKLLKTENDLVSLLFLQSLVISQISGALFADSMLWICLVLILGLDIKNEEKVLVQP